MLPPSPAAKHADSHKEEMANQKPSEDLKAAKSDEIKVGEGLPALTRNLQRQRKILRSLDAKHAVALKGVLTRVERKVIAAFIQNPQD